jgi:membrane-associated phospholipid phosphatase
LGRSEERGNLVLGSKVLFTKGKAVHGLLISKMIFQNNRWYFFMVNLILDFLVFYCITSTTQAQKDSTPDQNIFNKKYIVSYWHDTKKIIAEPIHWKAKQWSIFAGVLGVSVITYVYDNEIYNFFQQNRTERTESVSKYIIEPWGSGLYSIPLLTGIYITGINNDHHRNVALTGLKAFLLSGGAAQVTKFIFHRHRPGDDDPPNPYLWEGPFEFTTSYTSFPSGHTTTAFAVASALAQGYKDKLWVGITSYSVATIVGISRIHDGKHWPTDVIGGAALGTFIGSTLSKINFEKNKNLVIIPITIKGGYGLSFIYCFD